MFDYNRLFLAVAAAALMPSALAQPAPRPAPTDPAAAAPAVRYESAFAGYVPHQEPEIAAWRDVNDEAARIGGHIGILRQSGMHGGKPSAGSTSPSAAPIPARPAVPGHGTGR